MAYKLLLHAKLIRFSFRPGAPAERSHAPNRSGLTNEIRVKIVKASPKTLAGVRDAALISVGYDTLCRSSEIAAMRIDHLDIRRRRDRGDAHSAIQKRHDRDGRITYLSSETTDLLRRWLTETDLKGGPLFTSLHLSRFGQQVIDTSSIRRLIKRAAQCAGVNADLSGHSMRIGAAQDMMVAGFDALAIMKAGGGKSGNIVLRYVEKASTRELCERRWRSLGSQPYRPRGSASGAEVAGPGNRSALRPVRR